MDAQGAQNTDFAQNAQNTDFRPGQVQQLSAEGVCRLLAAMVAMKVSTFSRAVQTVCGAKYLTRPLLSPAAGRRAGELGLVGRRGEV